MHDHSLMEPGNPPDIQEDVPQPPPYRSLRGGFVAEFDLDGTKQIEVFLAPDDQGRTITDPDTIGVILDYFGHSHIVFRVPDEWRIMGRIILRFAYPNRLGWEDFEVKFDSERALICRNDLGVWVPDEIMLRLLDSQYHLDSRTTS